MIARLSDASWRGTRYDRGAVRRGVVHLGLGAFHRAHQAPVFDALIARGDARWGIEGVAMRSPDLVAALSAQDGLYSLTERGGQPASPQVIGAITALHVAAMEPDAVIGAIAGADTQLVTLTVTEKGYLDHGAQSPAGLIARALDRRRRSGLGPITVMSCDNRAGNGPFARDAVLVAAQGAGIADAGLRWIAEENAFPSTMVDRITPATTPAMIDETGAALGLRDEAAVWTEPFWQWVVEDRFAAARPDLAPHGVQIVADVEPWEKAKLRLLNAAHSTLAYGGLLRDHAYVHQAIGDAGLARLVEALWDEATETVDRGAVDVPAYRAALVQRFTNPELHHALIQIAADGSQKMPPRLLGTMAERAWQGLASPALATAVALWMLALGQVDGLVDPMLSDLQMLVRRDVPATHLLARIGMPEMPAGEIEAALGRLRVSGARGDLMA